MKEIYSFTVELEKEIEKAIEKTIIDKETGEPYAKDHAKYESRSNVCPLPLKKRYTAALWSALKTDLT